jgi:hypothetical protein
VAGGDQDQLTGARPTHLEPAVADADDELIDPDRVTGVGAGRQVDRDLVMTRVRSGGDVAQPVPARLVGELGDDPPGRALCLGRGRLRQRRQRARHEVGEAA